MPDPKPDEVWRDTVNLDLLLVKEIDPAAIDISVPPTAESLKRYARCLAFCSEGSFSTLPSMKFMGMQEMQFKHFDGPRFIKLPWYKAMYYRWRMKEWMKSGGF